MGDLLKEAIEPLSLRDNSDDHYAMVQHYPDVNYQGMRVAASIERQDITKALDAALAAQKEAVDAAFTAQEKAVAAAQEACDRQLFASNESYKQLEANAIEREGASQGHIWAILFGSGALISTAISLILHFLH